MVRIDCLIFGYRRIYIQPKKISDATAILLRGSVPSRFSSKGEIIVRERDYSKIQELFIGRIEFTSSNTLGFYGKLKCIENKAIVAVAIVFSVIIALILSSVVWDIRVEGNPSIPSSTIIYQLSLSGFKVGDFWIQKDLSSIETDMLLLNENISWININRRGTVAYVNILEGNTQEDETDHLLNEYGNIVSNADCVIEEITVISGTAMVKPGDPVKKGDILIAGITPVEYGGHLCLAKGSVIGRIEDTVSVNVDRMYNSSSAKKKKLYSIDIKLFNFSINIFKLYGNLTNNCGIIENEKILSVFGKVKLPFSTTLSYICESENDVCEYTDELICEVASERLMSLTASRLQDCDLLKMKTHGEFTDLGYNMVCDMVFLTDIGETLIFKVD